MSLTTESGMFQSVEVTLMAVPKLRDDNERAEIRVNPVNPCLNYLLCGLGALCGRNAQSQTTSSRMCLIQGELSRRRPSISSVV